MVTVRECWGMLMNGNVGYPSALLPTFAASGSIGVMRINAVLPICAAFGSMRLIHPDHGIAVAA